MEKISYLKNEATIKKLDQSQENYVIEGYANVYNIIDSHNDIIKPDAFTDLSDCKNVKFLWQHIAEKPIGKITDLYSDSRGLFIKAVLDTKIDQAKEASRLIESGIINGLSVGFEVLEHSYENSVRIITKAKLWEVSIVTFPANQLSVINKNLEYKMFETKLLEERLNNIEKTLSRPNLSTDSSDNGMSLFIKTGDASFLETKAALTSGNDSAGYTITPEFNSRILGGIEVLSPMRKISSVETISSNVLELLIEDSKFTSGWTQEAGERAETDSARITKKQIHVHELYAQPKATQRLIDDNEVNIEQWLAEKLQHSFTKVENEAFINGDGEGKPRGILTYGNEHIHRVKAQEAQNISFDDLLSLISAMPDQYASNASFLMHRATLMHIRSLKDATGRFIWQPSAIVGAPETIFGIPVYSCEEMPVIGENATPVALADFKSAYKIVDRRGINMMRDPYTEKPFVKFYATKRVGGDVVETKAIKLLAV